MGRIYINPPTLLPILGAYEQRLAALGLPVVINRTGKTISDEHMALQALDAHAIVAGLEKYPASFLHSAKELKILAKYGVGYDNIDVSCAKALQLPVTVTTGSNSRSVADFTFASILALLCRLPERHKNVVGGHWIRQPHPSLAGHTIGIVGAGRVGRLVAKHAKSLGWKVLVVDPAYTHVDEVPPADELCSLEDVLERAEIITLHYPKSGSQVDIDADKIARMRRGTIFANLARGGMVDEAALADALAREHLGGVVLDVFAQEPSPDVAGWRDLGNVILSPHVAGSSVDAVRLGFEMCLESLEYAFGRRTQVPRATYISGRGAITA